MVLCARSQTTNNTKVNHTTVQMESTETTPFWAKQVELLSELLGADSVHTSPNKPK
jgi:hypothetical protein